MGMRPYKNSCCRTTKAPADPDPARFKIISASYANGYTIATVIYPNCTTFGGQKLLVFEGNKTDYLKNTQYLDPHFLESNEVIARIRPDEKGVKIIELLMGGER